MLEFDGRFKLVLALLLLYYAIRKVTIFEEEFIEYLLYHRQNLSEQKQVDYNCDKDYNYQHETIIKYVRKRRCLRAGRTWT